MARSAHRQQSSARDQVSNRLQRLSPNWTEYQLMDTGGGRKLERFGPGTLIRPEPQAKWPPALPESQWNAADAVFFRSADERKGQWKFLRGMPERWKMRREALEFWVQPAPSGHVGIFPDQACHWDWMAQLVKSAERSPHVLSLFGHTGLGTLSAAAVGARVTHVDASQKAIKWARDNQALSGLANRPIRWIVEDALKFVTREVKRGHQYDALFVDPPQFGRGPGGELWKIDDSLPVLLRFCRHLLSDSPRFVLLNTYATVLTSGEAERQARKLRAHVAGLLSGHAAAITSGELVLADSAGRQISASVFARAVIGRARD